MATRTGDTTSGGIGWNKPLENFEGQAEACERLGSPFTAGLCRLIPEVSRGSGFGDRLRGWPGDARADALALRACGALNALVLRGISPELSSVYPPKSFDRARLEAGLSAAIRAHDDFLAAYLDSPPQTNEVGRSPMILGAALHVAGATRLPLEVYELGASAGLNLWFADYAYDFGADRTWGRADAPLTIASEWAGDVPPLGTPLAIAARHACDQNPLDPANPNDRLRLTSYVWPDQSVRLDRVKRALGYAATQDIKVEQADAADWVSREFAAPPEPGRARVLYHTVVWQYLPEETKVRITLAMNKAGEAATAQTPLAWFRFENDGGDDGGRMELTLWPGGETRQLGRADFHGRWVRWRADRND